MDVDIIYEQQAHKELLPGAEEEAEFGECFILFICISLYYKLTNGLIPGHNKLNNSVVASVIATCQACFACCH